MDGGQRRFRIHERFDSTRCGVTDSLCAFGPVRLRGGSGVSRRESCSIAVIASAASARMPTSGQARAEVVASW